MGGRRRKCRLPVEGDPAFVEDRIERRAEYLQFVVRGAHAHQLLRRMTGDTLRLIAQSLWGDSSLWYKLAQANGMNGDETLAAGRVLVIPQNVGSIHHNATTFQPYDPNKAIGDTFPGSVEPPVQPAPPKGKKGCGIIGQILVAAISVAVTMILPGIVGVLLVYAGLSMKLGDPRTIGPVGLPFLFALLLVGGGIAKLLTLPEVRKSRYFWVFVASGAISLLMGLAVLFNWAAVSAGFVGVVLGLELVADGGFLAAFAFRDRDNEEHKEALGIDAAP